MEEVEAYTQQDDVEDDDSSGCTSSTRQDSPSDIALSIQDNPVQPHNHQFPSTYFGNKYRSFNPEWFHKNVWLEYSISRDAVFCYACRFFSLGSANDVFVKTGYCDWKHCTGKTGRIVKHSNSVKHKQAMASWSDFKANQDKQTSVASALDRQRKEEVIQNRYYLKTIIELLIFCASQEIGFRGHRESEASDSTNRGNFLELLHLVARHDPAIQRRLGEGPRNAIYIAHNIQDELLHLLGTAVRQIICQGVKDAGYFSILADESRDCGKDEQMSFVVRYVESDGSNNEHFMTFIHAKGLNAESLASYIRGLLEQYDFDATALVSQGYDGASVMSGTCTGVQKRVREFAPNAVYIHCYAHVLNLVLVDSVKSVLSASEFFILLEALYVFVSTSKVHVIFKEKQLLIHPGKQPVELQQLSDTRWVCRYAAVNAICCSYDSLLLTIEEVAKSSDARKAIEARGLLHQIKTFSFIVSLVIFDRILSCTKHLSDQLQSSTIDLSVASDLVFATKSMLRDYRTTDYWRKIYKYSTDIASLHSIPLQQTEPRRKRRLPSHLADSVPFESFGFRDEQSTSEELKTTLFFPVLDKFLIELENRFDDKNMIIMNGIAACCPASNRFLRYEDLKRFADSYNISTDGLEVEVSLLRKVVPDRSDISSLASFRNYLYSSRPAYESIFKLTQIALTIAVTSAECERSFSSLKRIKTRLRTTMVEERLADLSILSIEKEIARRLNLDNIVDQFAASNNQRMALN